MVNCLRKQLQDMASASMNHYEEQLYSVFKTFDVDNEEALDRSSVLQLCDTLQLEDRGAALVDTLFERQSDRVTFAQFRNGLLSVLGGEPAPRSECPRRADTKDTDVAPPGHSDDDSSGREVAPKFVFGSKKYGRRSRPQRTASEDSPRHRVASESRLDSVRARQRMRCKRSASAMEARDDCAGTGDDDAAELNHDRRVDRKRVLALCRALHLHGVDRCVVDRIFEASSAEEITVGDFFDQLNSSLTNSIASLDGATSNENPTLKNDVVTSDAVVEAWDRAGVKRPRCLLIELGFASSVLRPYELERVLDEELQALAASEEAMEARYLLLLAAHALSRMRLESAWRLLDVARAERDKLRDDLAEANRRARMLAQDVDENHARIEAELKLSLKQVEARHAETARVAAAESAAERERTASAQLALEQETARRAETEARLRAEVSTLRRRIDEVQERTKEAEEHAEQVEREQAKLREDVREAEARGALAAERERAVMSELRTRERALRDDNQRLRDRCDELASALETGAARRAPGEPSVCWRDELEESDLHESELTKRQPLDSRALEDLKYVFKKVKDLPANAEARCPSCQSLSEANVSVHGTTHGLSEELAGESSNPSATVEADATMRTGFDTNDMKEVELLRKELQELRQKYENDGQNASALIKELESSLEQMRVEYERCEEYWAGKLEEERDALAEEQRAGDERLAELARAVADYERQFARPLPPIAEAGAFELQVAQLEDEFAQYRADKEADLASKAEEIKQLKGRVEELERRPAPPVPVASPASGVRCGAPLCGAAWRAGEAAGARESGVLRARAARAERVVQRLHARLAAADLLVKDLYLENCRLAHLPRLP